jgi:hypothetical protein
MLFNKVSVYLFVLISWKCGSFCREYLSQHVFFSRERSSHVSNVIQASSWISCMRKDHAVSSQDGQSSRRRVMVLLSCPHHGEVGDISPSRKFCHKVGCVRFFRPSSSWFTLSLCWIHKSETVTQDIWLNNFCDVVHVKREFDCMDRGSSKARKLLKEPLTKEVYPLMTHIKVSSEPLRNNLIRHDSSCRNDAGLLK